MKTEQLLLNINGEWTQKGPIEIGNSAQLVFLFGSRELLKKQEHIDKVRSSYPAAKIVGCSTSGEICGEMVHSDRIVCTAVWFEKTTVRIVAEHIETMEQSYEIGEKLAGQLSGHDLVHAMILSEGLNINGSELTKGLNNKLMTRVPITGGLAGDEANFTETVIVNDKAGERNTVLAIGFYGKELKTGYGSMGGWDSFGVDRLVTRSKSNILYELDGQPALELYKKYLGEHAKGLPAAALLFPLSLRLQNSDTALVRTVLSVNETDGSMVFAGDIPQGEYVRLMKANIDRLIEGANDAAEMSCTSLRDEEPDLAILISCVGRRLVLKQRVEEELESVREMIGQKAMMTGFYSYGEICPSKPFENRCELHNQTMTITLFKEL